MECFYNLQMKNRKSMIKGILVNAKRDSCFQDLFSKLVDLVKYKKGS